MVFYTLVKELLQGKRPMTKFVVIKLVVSIVSAGFGRAFPFLSLSLLLQVAVTYYQAFLFSALVSHGVIKENGG